MSIPNSINSVALSGRRKNFQNTSRFFDRLQQQRSIREFVETHRLDTAAIEVKRAMGCPPQGAHVCSA